MAFKLLDEQIQAFIADKKWGEATAPQAEAIPRILKGDNVLLVAPTGLGKTEAAILPLFHKMLEGNPPGISVLYITPLRALNRDMLKRMTDLGEWLGVSVAVRHGDTTQKERNRQSKTPPQILITTPETLQVLFTGSKLREHIKNVKHVVIDEVHELAGSDRGIQLAVGIERLEAHCKRPFQRVGLSATVGDLGEIARFVGGRSRKVNIVKVPVAREMEITVETPSAHKDEKEIMGKIKAEKGLARNLLHAKKLMEEHTSTLLFVNTRDTAEALGARFSLIGAEGVLVHHGSLSKEIRVDAEDSFKEGKTRALICTSSLELGIDIGSADLVIQYNSPRSPSRLIQRVGRSGHSVRGKPKGRILADHPDEVAEACAIASMSVGEDLETWKVRPNPIEVLANQTISFYLNEGRGKSLDDFYNIITETYPFNALTKDDFDKTINFLLENRLLRERDDGPGSTKRGRDYFYENISMIPDERSFKLRDITTYKIIGRLDEKFVASYVQPTATVVVGGRTWEVVSTDDEEVLVEPAREVGEIPHWSGEDLPVPFEVAQKVGSYRDKGALPRGGKRWTRNTGSAKLFSDYIKEQAREEGSISGRDTIVIEGRAGDVVINSCFGTRVNETLGKLVSGLLAARLGQSVSLRAEAYRIMLHGPPNMDANKVAETLNSIEPDNMESILRIILKNTSYMRWHFVHSARKFGVMRKEVDYSVMNLGRIMEEYYDTPVYKAALDKVLWERMDLARTEQVLRDITAGRREVLTSPKISKIGATGYERINEVVMSRKPTHAILSALRERLEKEKALLLCLGCKKGFAQTVGEVEEHIKCPYCAGRMVAALHPRERDDAMEALKGKDTPKNRKKVRNMQKNASIVMSHGKRAVIALRGRGIGPDKASRILGFYRDEEEFLAAILKAEVEYARNRRFWD